MRRPPLRPLVGRLMGNRREALLAYRGLGMGNILYFLLQAQIRRAHGTDLRISVDNDSREWTDLVDVDDLVLDPSEVRFSDRRVEIDDVFFQHYGVSFTGEQLRSFIVDRMLATEYWRRSSPQPSSDVVVNVRRGDYYDGGQNEANYGFDIVEYLRRSLDEVAAECGTPGRLTVVSDDAQWCRDHLGWLNERAGSTEFIGRSHGVAASFHHVATARTLVLGNSTFSYWAAYVSDVIHGRHGRGLGGPPEVWAPLFHSSTARHGSPLQHAPHWQGVPVSRGDGAR